MLNLDVPVIERTEPFQLFLANGLLDQSQLDDLRSTAPTADAELIAVDDPRHEKQYRMNLVSLVEAEADTVHADRLPPNWTEFVAELRGDRFTNWLVGATGIELKGTQRSIGIYTHRNGDFLSVHKDKPTKAITVIIYLNTDWPAEAGGRFQGFTSGDRGGRPVSEIMPVGGQLLAFRPTEQSWHAVSKITHPDGVERVTVQVEYWLSTELMGSAYKPATDQS
jgi:Rps23 Pro-64 3,4-dihydroxylase Tpa1-like proline 4-hydroxylase